MGKIISFSNQKGGVGKTTSTFTIGNYLSKNNRVLLVDLDPQASLTIYAGVEPYGYDNGIVELIRNEDLEVQKGILPVDNNLYIMPSRIELAGVENEIIGKSGREFILKNILDEVQDKFDYILIDCPPQLSTLTLNALTASDGVVIPSTPSYLAYRGLNELSKTITSVKKYYNPNLRNLGVLITVFEARNNDDKEMVELIESEYGTVLGKIKKTVKMKETVYGNSITTIDKTILEEYGHVVENIQNKLK